MRLCIGVRCQAEIITDSAQRNVLAFLKRTPKSNVRFATTANEVSPDATASTCSHIAAPPVKVPLRGPRTETAPPEQATAKCLSVFEGLLGESRTTLRVARAAFWIISILRFIPCGTGIVSCYWRAIADALNESLSPKVTSQRTRPTLRAIGSIVATLSDDSDFSRANGTVATQTYSPPAPALVIPTAFPMI